MVTQTGNSRAGDRRRLPRVPFGRPVRVHFGPLRDVVEAATADISVGGMFIKTTSFRLPGAELEFRITLSDASALIEGSAEVVRVYGGDESEFPSGMGVHFLELRGNSAALLRSVVEEHRRA